MRQILGTIRQIIVICIFRVGGNRLIGELHDATLSWMGPNGFVLTGFQIINGVAYAQSWWYRLPH
jgi:ABC-type transport system involved in cytochrome c biogenesis permease subunit